MGIAGPDRSTKPLIVRSDLLGCRLRDYDFEGVMPSHRTGFAVWLAADQASRTYAKNPLAGDVDNTRSKLHCAGVVFIFVPRSATQGFAMPEPFTLTGLLLGAAAACGAAVVEEATKDAYAGLKAKVIEVFGSRTGRSVAKLENVATCEEGKLELDQSIGDSLSPEEASELEPFVIKMMSALRADQAAREVAHARIGLDLDVGGDALLKNIQGAREIAIKAVTKGDFTLEDIRMDVGRTPGK